MLVTRRSPLTGKDNTMEIPVSHEDLSIWQAEGTLIQKAFPHLTADQREFLMTGYTPEDWLAMFPRTCEACDFAEIEWDDQDERPKSIVCRCEIGPHFNKPVAAKATCAYWKAA